MNERESIRTSRDIKEEALERGVTTKGLQGEELKKVYEDVNIVRDILEKDYPEWITEQQGKIVKMFPDIPAENLKESFDKGLEVFFTQQFRLFRKTGQTALLDDVDYLHGQIFAYTFDFIQSLKQSGKLSISSGPALEVAQYSYLHNPDAVQSLRRKYPSLPDYVVTLAITSHPVNPEGFLKGVAQTIDDLKIQYPKTQYPNLEDSVITRAAVSHSSDNARQFIEQFLKKFTDLKKEYPSPPDFVIVNAVSNYPSSSKKFLEQFLKAIEILKKNNPDVPEGKIIFVANNNPSNPQKALDAYKHQELPEETEETE